MSIFHRILLQFALSV